MKKIKTILMALSCVFILSSCRKDAVVVEGYVYDVYTKKPLANVEVSFVKGWKMDPGSSRKLSSTYTDATGFYRIERSAKNADEITAECFDKNVMFGRGDTTYKRAFSNEKFQTVNLYVNQKATYVLKLKNVTPYDDNDKIHFWNTYPMAGGNNYYGKNVDVSIELYGIANTQNYFQYQITKNGVASPTYKYTVKPTVDSVAVYYLNY